MEGINYPSEKDYWKKIEKNDAITVINVLYVKKKKKKYILPTFQNITQSVKNKLFIQGCTIKKNGIILQ